MVRKSSCGRGKGENFAAVLLCAARKRDRNRNCGVLKDEFGIWGLLSCGEHMVEAIRQAE